MTFWAKSVLQALFFPIVVYFFQFLTILCFDVYQYLPDFDVPMHFLGGVSIALGLATLLEKLKGKRFLSIRLPLLDILLLVSGTTMIAVIWEWYEFVVTEIAYVSVQGTVRDTMGDLFLGALGSLIVALWYVRRGYRQTKKT